MFRIIMMSDDFDIRTDAHATCCVRAYVRRNKLQDSQHYFVQDSAYHRQQVNRICDPIETKKNLSNLSCTCTFPRNQPQFFGCSVQFSCATRISDIQQFSSHFHLNIVARCCYSVILAVIFLQCIPGRITLN